MTLRHSHQSGTDTPGNQRQRLDDTVAAEAGFGFRISEISLS